MITKPRLIIAAVFALWAAIVAAVLHIAGLASVVCGAGSGLSSPPTCDWGVEFFAWALLAVVIIGGARIVKRLAGRLGITID